LKVVTQGKVFRDMQEPKDHPLTVSKKLLNTENSPGTEASLNLSVRDSAIFCYRVSLTHSVPCAALLLQIHPPKVSFQDSGRKTMLELRAQMAFGSLRSSGTAPNATSAVAPAGAATNLDTCGEFVNPVAQDSDDEDDGGPEDT
jgi:hypothetical protein